MLKILGAKHKSKSSSDAYTGWGFIAGFIIAIIIVILSNITIFRDQIFFDKGNNIDAIVVGYDWFPNTSDNGRYLLEIEFTDIDGNNYKEVFNYFLYHTATSAEANIGKTIPIKTNGHGKFLQGIKRPHIPVFVYALFFVFSIFGIVGIRLVIKYQWLISEYRVLKKGQFCDFMVLSFEKRKEKDKYYRLKMQIITDAGKKDLYTHSRFSEGEAALCFALPKSSKNLYRAKYKNNKVIIVEDFDYSRECMENKKKTVYFENGKMVINFDYESDDYKSFQKFKDSKVNCELKIKERLTTDTRKKFGIGGKFTIPQIKQVIGTETTEIYVKSRLDKLADRYVGKKIKIFHNPLFDEIDKVDMTLNKNDNGDLCTPLSEKDSLELLTKYGNWFELDGYILKVFIEENVILCEIKVPVFGELTV